MLFQVKFDMAKMKASVLRRSDDKKKKVLVFIINGHKTNT